MNEKYQKMLKQNKAWAIAGLVLPTTSTILLSFLILFDMNDYTALFATSIIVLFASIASYWWWWTMYQLYNVTKNAGSTEQKMSELGQEFQSIKEDIKSL